MSVSQRKLRAVGFSGDGPVRRPLIAGFHVHRVGVEIKAGIDQRSWYEFGKLLQQVDYAHDWILADWLAYGGHEYGDKIYQLASGLLGKSPRTWEDYAYIARNVQASERSEILSILVHKPVARLGDRPELQRKLIGIAEQHGLSKSVFEAVIAHFLEGKSYRHLLPRQITPLERARIRAHKERARVLREARKKDGRAWLPYVREQIEGWQQLLQTLEHEP